MCPVYWPLAQAVNMNGGFKVLILAISDMPLFSMDVFALLTLLAPHQLTSFTSFLCHVTVACFE